MTDGSPGRPDALTLANRYRSACAALGLPVWRPGMAPVLRYPPADGWCWRLRSAEDLDLAEGWYNGMEPNFDDPATVGCLLAAARTVWGPHCSAMASQYEAEQDRWRVFDGRLTDDGYGHEVGNGYTEAEALVAALEKAAARQRGEA